ncbi:sigma-70 family RNA polymerase sigma factor [Streptomyces sp900105755]|uniref:Sigma-70 family RNA polymerase sigma factor n=1 Tax=Streptomyces sp. 900105755 TaxID=3154389 RepID=A0ABV1TWX4_9ACTN
MTASMGPEAVRELTDDELLDVLEAQPRPDLNSRRMVYGEIARRHRATVERFVSASVDHHDAPDIAQQTFIDAFAYLEKNVSLAPPRRLRGWLVQCARRRILKYRERNGRVRPGLTDDMVSEAKDAERPVVAGHDPIRLEMTRRLLTEVHESLDTDEQRLYSLRILKGLSSKDAAARLEEPFGAVKGRCTRLQTTVAERFHVLLLIRGGRKGCPTLDALLTDYEAQHGRGLTKELTKLVTKHYETCAKCGNCGVCRTTRQQLIWDAAPVAIPVILAGAFAESIERAVRTAGDMTPTAFAEQAAPAPVVSVPSSPPRTARRGLGRRARVTALAAAVAAVIAAVAIATRPHHAAGAGPVDAANLTRQQQAARAISQAMVSRSVTAFDIEARNLGDPNEFHGQGRISMSPHDTNAATHVLYEPGEDPWFPQTSW